MVNKTYFNWSSGKDAALALYKLQQNPNYQVDLLVTTSNKNTDRVAMHGLRNELLIEQAKQIGLPLEIIEMGEMPTMEAYNEIMNEAMSSLKSKGYTHAGFGDIFLEDLKSYREQQHHEVGLNLVFPLWKKDTKKLIHEFIDLGFKSIVINVKNTLLGEEYVGKIMDKAFIDSLPDNVDPCGENGEFHTFCFDGPIFKAPVAFEIGPKVLKRYPNPEKRAEVAELDFWYVDLLPK